MLDRHEIYRSMAAAAVAAVVADNETGTREAIATRRTCIEIEMQRDGRVEGSGGQARQGAHDKEQAIHVIRDCNKIVRSAHVEGNTRRYLLIEILGCFVHKLCRAAYVCECVVFFSSSHTWKCDSEESSRPTKSVEGWRRGKIEPIDVQANRGNELIEVRKRQSGYKRMKKKIN